MTSSQAGADVDCGDSHYGGSALLFAAYHGHVQVVTTLLDHRADINFAATDGTPLLHAEQRCSARAASRGSLHAGVCCGSLLIMLTCVQY